MNLLSKRLSAYLQSWYCSSTTEKMLQGVRVELTFEQFLDLFEVRQLNSLQRAIDTDRLRYQQSADNKMAYVLTWRDYAARSSNVYSNETACVCARWKSAELSRPKPGDELRASHRAKIAAGLTGKLKTPEHRDAISEATAGVSKVAWSEERKAARSVLRQKQEAARRAVGGK